MSVSVEKRWPRIALCQFTPDHSSPSTSARKVEDLPDAELTASKDGEQRGGVDLIIAPEMCLTGYVFKARNQIEGLCEEVAEEKGATIQLAKNLSERYGCYTLLGFPEVDRGGRSAANDDAARVVPAHDARPSYAEPFSDASSTAAQYHNSSLLTSPGSTSKPSQVLHAFRKHFLFTSDETWCTPSGGAGFQLIDLPEAGRIGVAICMDLNPYQFKSDWSDFELAKWAKREKVDILILQMAWVKSEPTDGSGHEDPSEEPDWQSVNYWAARCEPLWKWKDENDADGQGKETLFVACNRTGTESGMTFAGSSCVMSFKSGQRPQVLAVLGQKEERALLWSPDSGQNQGDHEELDP